MGDNVVYMRSSTTNGILPLNYALNDRFIDDLRRFVDLDERQFDTALKAISSGQRFLGREMLAEILKSELEEPVADLLTRVTRTLHRIENDGPGIETLTRQLASVERDDKPSEPVFSEEQLKTLQTRISRLSDHWSALDRQKKAENLGKVTGQRLLEIQLICDLRPVFDKKRETIEGMIPITTLHLVFEGVDGLPNGVDVTLSASDVKNLRKITGFAEKKLSTLRSTVNELNKIVPSTDITHVPEEEVNE